MSVIRVNGLVKRYRRRDVVRDLSFEVPAGSVTAFLGLNGAGKTTTLRVLLGLTAPTSGTAEIFGRPYAALDHPARRVGTVLEAHAAHPGHTGRRHVSAIAAAAGVPKQRVAAVLDRVGLTAAADARVKTYSLGMKQRLALATALLGSPELLILDEPTNGLDPAGVRELRDTVRQHAAAGGTVLVSSHQLAEISQVVDRAVVIHHGRLVGSGPIGDIMAGHATLEDAFFALTQGPAGVAA
jgi:ABC-2 type transport system ATP-binding protein